MLDMEQDNFISIMINSAVKEHLHVDKLCSINNAYRITSNVLEFNTNIISKNRAYYAEGEITHKGVKFTCFINVTTGEMLQ